MNDSDQFEDEFDLELTLMYSGQKLCRSTIINPLIVISNRFLSSLRQDYFEIDSEDQLWELQCALQMPNDKIIQSATTSTQNESTEKNEKVLETMVVEKEKGGLHKEINE